MDDGELHVVTGAFGYSGGYIARRLLEHGYRVRTLTNRPASNHFGGRIAAFPLDFRDHVTLVASLRGATVLYNTYWVRFNHSDFSHESAVRNTFRLFAAAGEAGVRRIVHVSVTNPSEDSPLEYFRGKARIERELKETGISHAVLRPAVLFGGEDILVNNIAWLLRTFPVFGIIGDGDYRLQPVHVDDMARMAVELGGVSENLTVNAIGPETFTYRELVETIGAIVGKSRRIVRLSAEAGYLLGAVIGLLVRDVLITRDEIKGLTAGLLHVDSSPAGGTGSLVGATRLTEWARENAAVMGVRYASELARRTRFR